MPIVCIRALEIFIVGMKNFGDHRGLGAVDGRIMGLSTINVEQGPPRGRGVIIIIINVHVIVSVAKNPIWAHQ
jgi:hypothetical protein